MVGEWSLFESSSSITFITGEPGAWRCAPGASVGDVYQLDSLSKIDRATYTNCVTTVFQFESRLMLSATIPAMLIPLSLILAMCRAKWMRPLVR